MRAGLAALLLAAGVPAAPATLDEEVGKRLEMTKAVKVGQGDEVTEKYNAHMSSVMSGELSGNVCAVKACSVSTEWR